MSRIRPTVKRIKELEDRVATQKEVIRDELKLLCKTARSLAAAEAAIKVQKEEIQRLREANKVLDNQAQYRSGFFQGQMDAIEAISGVPHP